MKKVREHREWFRTIVRPKHCPTCKSHTQVWSWGEYAPPGRWRTVKHFCEFCFPKIKKQLKDHSDPCGCTITLVGYGGKKLPDWLTLED